MLWRTLPLTFVVATAAAQPPAPGRTGRPATPPGAVAVVADTATVRRICAQPDSVIAGRKACVLRDQRDHEDLLTAASRGPAPGGPMTPPDSFGSGVLAGMLLALGAQAIHWFITPAAHPNASTAQAVAVSAQAALSFGVAGWLVRRARRVRVGPGAPVA